MVNEAAARTVTTGLSNGDQTWRDDARERDPLAARRSSVATNGPVSQLLAKWRAADRELARTVQGSLEFAAVEAQVAAMRAAYHRLFDEHTQTGPAPSSATDATPGTVRACR